MRFSNRDRGGALESLRAAEFLDASPRTRLISRFLRGQLKQPVVRSIGWQTDVPRDEELLRTLADCADRVYRLLGEGLPSTAYEDCFSREMSLRGLDFRRNHPVPVVYEGLELRDCGRLTHLVEDSVAILICPTSREIALYERRLTNWIRLGGWPGGLLIDFDAA
ncbi:MAG: GxxExxY protein [Gammaproteobacteria bacterium]